MGCGPSHEDLPPVRVLLLGPGGCGKSTIVKQMKVNYKNGFDQSELEGKILKLLLNSAIVCTAFIFQKLKELKLSNLEMSRCSQANQNKYSATIGDYTRLLCRSDRR